VQYSQAQCTTSTISLTARCTPRTFIARHGLKISTESIPLKNQKEQGVALQTVRICTAKRYNTVIFDLAMEYLVESKNFR